MQASFHLQAQQQKQRQRPQTDYGSGGKQSYLAVSVKYLQIRLTQQQQITSIQLQQPSQTGPFHLQNINYHNHTGFAHLNGNHPPLPLLVPSRSAPVPNSPASVATYAQPILSYNYNNDNNKPQDNNYTMTAFRTPFMNQGTASLGDGAVRSHHSQINNNQARFNQNMSNHERKVSKKSNRKSNSKSSNASSSTTSKKRKKKKKAKAKKSKKSKFGAYIKKKNLATKNENKNNNNQSFADYQKRNLSIHDHSKDESVSTTWTESTYNTDAEALRNAGFVISAQYMCDEDSF